MAKPSVLIVYGTVSGNTELVVQKIATILKQNEVSTKLSRVELTNAKEVVDHQYLILASPTYYHGETEAHFPAFLEALSSLDLTKTSFAVIGLGDKKYYPEYLCDSAKVFEEFLATHQAQTFAPSLRIGTSPIKLLDSTVKNWAQRVVKTIKEL